MPQIQFDFIMNDFVLCFQLLVVYASIFLTIPGSYLQAITKIGSEGTLENNMHGTRLNYNFFFFGGFKVDKDRSGKWVGFGQNQ